MACNFIIVINMVFLMFSNLFILGIPNEDYFRNESCVLNGYIHFLSAYNYIYWKNNKEEHRDSYHGRCKFT
jgi:hypothetical protein